MGAIAPRYDGAVKPGERGLLRLGANHDGAFSADALLPMYSRTVCAKGRWRVAQEHHFARTMSSSAG